MNIRISTFIFAFLLMGILLPLLTSQTASGVGPVRGCCTTLPDGGQCVGCPDGEQCFTSEEFCQSQGGFYRAGFDLACLTGNDGAFCGPSQQGGGCCVIEPGNCEEVESFLQCFSGELEFAELFIFNQSCSEVRQCDPPKNIPTMSNWGLIALAAIFVLVGIWAMTRKKSEA